MPRRRRVDLTKLNPYDAPDMAVINDLWERKRRRDARRATRRGWLRVAAVIVTYLALGIFVFGAVVIILTAFRLLFA